MYMYVQMEGGMDGWLDEWMNGWVKIWFYIHADTGSIKWSQQAWKSKPKM